MKKSLYGIHILALFVSLIDESPAISQVKDLSYEEGICRNIGFKPKTPAFGSCVIELSERTTSDQGAKVRSQSEVPTRRRDDGKARLDTAQANNADSRPLSSHGQTCIEYGFKKNTADFSQCLMQLDGAQRQAELQQQQYNLQIAQYQQQLAAYNAQQEEIRREKNRRQGEMLMRMSQGMLNSRSPSLLGGIADGLAAVNGTPIPQPVPPPLPASQNYTIRMPNGNQVYCNYNSNLGYMSCR